MSCVTRYSFTGQKIEVANPVSAGMEDVPYLVNDGVLPVVQHKCNKMPYYR